MPNAEECTTLLMETMPRLMRGFGAAMRQAQDDEETLTPGQMRMLGLLCHAPRTLSELATLHNVTPSTMSRTVDALVLRDWISREPGPRDRRQVILSLTEAGRAMHAEMHQRAKAALSAKLGQLDESERERLRDGLLVLQKLMEQYPHPGQPAPEKPAES